MEIMFVVQNEMSCFRTARTGCMRAFCAGFEHDVSLLALDFRRSRAPQHAEICYESVSRLILKRARQLNGFNENSRESEGVRVINIYVYVRRERNERYVSPSQSGHDANTRWLSRQEIYIYMNLHVQLRAPGSIKISDILVFSWAEPREKWFSLANSPRSIQPIDEIGAGPRISNFPLYFILPIPFLSCSSCAIEKPRFCSCGGPFPQCPTLKNSLMALVPVNNNEKKP